MANIDNLKARITTTIDSVDAGMLAASWREIDYRLDIFRATKGEGHTWKFIDKGHETFWVYLTIYVINFNLSLLFYELLNIKMSPGLCKHPT